MDREATKYGIAARRFLVRRGLRMMVEARMRESEATGDRMFLQAFRWTWAFARPAVEAHPEAASEVRESQAGEGFWGVSSGRWVRVAGWVEAWYRDGVFGANPVGEELTTEDVLEDRSSEKTHYYALRCYRRACVAVLEMLGDAVETVDPETANWRYERCYPAVLALGWPVVKRLEDRLATVEQRWRDLDGEGVRRARMDTVDEVVQAWHDAGIFSMPTVPRDETSRDDLLRLAQERGGA